MRDVTNKLRSIFYRSVIKGAKELKVFGKIYISHPDRMVIGSYCTFNHHCYLNSRGTITLGNSVSVSKGVSIISTGIDKISGKHYCKEVCIGDNVWLGANVTILPGVSITHSVVIGANSLVNKNISSPGTYVGNPLRKIK